MRIMDQPVPHESVGEAHESYTPGAADRIADGLGAVSRHLALLAAWIATCGSLFISEVIGWPPCELCWYQRILMYPLAIILPVGILRHDPKLHQYVLPLSIMGAGTALYHYLLIKTDWFPPPACSDGIPCTVDYIDWFGFINIPFMALTAFVIITIMMLVGMLMPAAEVDPAEAAAAPFWSMDRLAVPLIVVSVIITFLLASTFV
jgi:disulfide bond formation protein DsbB